MEFLKASFNGSPDLDEAKGLFAQVAEIFPKGGNQNHQLPWSLSTSSTRACLGVMKTEQGRDLVDSFVDDYLFKIVDLLLQQQ